MSSGLNITSPFLSEERKKAKQSYQESLQDVTTVRQQVLVSSCVIKKGGRKKKCMLLIYFLFHLRPSFPSRSHRVLRKQSKQDRRERGFQVKKLANWRRKRQKLTSPPLRLLKQASNKSLKIPNRPRLRASHLTTTASPISNCLQVWWYSSSGYCVPFTTS